MTTPALDVLVSQMNEVHQKFKLEPQLLGDIYWSSNDNRTDARMPHSERVDSWHEQRRAMKENQIRLARASDQQDKQLQDAKTDAPMSAPGRIRGSARDVNTSAPPPFGGVGTGFGATRTAAGASVVGSADNAPRRRMHTVFVQQLEFEDLLARQNDDAAAAAAAAAAATVAPTSSTGASSRANVAANAAAAASAPNSLTSSNSTGAIGGGGGSVKVAGGAGLMALQGDLVAEANQRRIRAINRKLEEEKARAAKQRAARARGSKASELDALAALERELLAEVGTGAATPAAKDVAANSHAQQLFKQPTTRYQALPPVAVASKVVPALPSKTPTTATTPSANATSATTAAPAVVSLTDKTVRVTFAVAESETITELDLALPVAAAKRRAHADLSAVASKPLKSVDDYMLFGGDFWSYESDVLRDMPYIKLCRAKGVRPRVELVSITAYKLFAQQVAAVTGFDAAHLSARSTEAAFCRERFAEQRLLQEFRVQEALNAFEGNDDDTNTESPTLPSYLPVDFALRIIVTTVLIKNIRCPTKQPVRDVLRDAVSFGAKALGGTATAASTSATTALPAWVLKIKGRHQFLLNPMEPIGLNEHVRARLRDGSDTIELVLIDTARCASTLAAAIARLVQADRSQRALSAFERRLSVDERLQRDAVDARIWLDSSAIGAAPASQAAIDEALMANVTPVAECDKRLRVRVLSLDGLDPHSASIKKLIKEKCKVCVTAQAFCAGVAIGDEASSEAVPLGGSVAFLSWLDSVAYRDLPWSAVLLLQVQAQLKKRDVAVVVGWATFRVFAHNDRARHGTHRVRLRCDEAGGAPDPLAPTHDADVDADAPTLTVELEILSRPVAFTPCFEHAPVALPRREAHMPAKAARDRVDEIVARDALIELTDVERVTVWTQRSYCRTRSAAAAKLLAAVPWAERGAVSEAYRVLREWEAPLAAVDALLVFSAACVDKVVRRFGTRQLDALPDAELANYLLQLVAALKHEPHHYSPLAEFLVRRALAAPHRLGQRVFWLLKAEAQADAHRERFGLLIEAYLRGCDKEERDELLRQHELNERLRQVATEAQDTKRDDRVRVVREALELVNQRLSKNFALPLDSTMRAKSIIVGDCRALDSKTMPLWLAFENDDAFGDPILVIFKAGDDLRQDQLTLQMFYLMDLMWLGSNLDLRTINYGCVASGPEVGFIQVVLNCNTSADIQLEAGGIKAAFSDKPLARWLRRQNASDELHARAADNLARSCAASCVATYVLGVCDRHNDNIMITRDGRLFHIDFGRFLGNYQMFGAFRRDRAPFVLTPEFVFAMGGKESNNFTRFCDMACKAFNVVRANARVFIALFSMMVSTGIPELQSIEDLDYLRHALALDLTEREAHDLFLSLINESLNTKATSLNFAIHLAARPD